MARTGSQIVVQISERNALFSVSHFQLRLFTLNPGFPLPLPQKASTYWRLFCRKQCTLFCNTGSSLLQKVTGFGRADAETVLPTWKDNKRYSRVREITKVYDSVVLEFCNSSHGKIESQQKSKTRRYSLELRDSSHAESRVRKEQDVFL
jgi:hypothetical protein